MQESHKWFQQALALAEGQRHAEALVCISKAESSTIPTDPRIVLAKAQIHLEAGLPASALFETARALAPNELEVVLGLAGALVAEGRVGKGVDALASVVREHPGWLAGHQKLVELRAATGEDNFDRGYVEAVDSEPSNAALRYAWFQALAAARQWERAEAVLHGIETEIGPSKRLVICGLFVASEAGAQAYDTELFDSVADIDDPGLDLAKVRHFLRGGQVERAEAVAVRHIGKTSVTAFWPYLSLIWRLVNDERAIWLDPGEPFTGIFDLGFSEAELEGLAKTLRSFHTLAAPYHNQSVRCGTQTDGNLLLRIDPHIVEVRRRIEAAVREYIDRLSRHQPGHPLLGTPRGAFRFSGSWSVRLGQAGHHKSHTHPCGWISSAMYVVLPNSGSSQGALQFGIPPPELHLSLGAEAEINPLPGQLVLFPSTRWHSTTPFDAGERLTIAFDVVAKPVQ